jgi:hypothetical protein
MDITQTLYQTLIASAAMMLIALIMFLIYFRSPGSKPHPETGDKNEMYLGGEEHPYDQETVGSANLFWSIVNQSMKNVYRKIVDRFNTYSVDSWLLYMSAWLAFLIILLIILVGVL